MKNSILKIAGMNALGTALYVVIVATFLSNTPRIFGNVPEPTVFIPVAMLLLLVTSASITGSLVLGRPILWYLDGKKKEAVTLFISTVAMLLACTVIAFGVLVFVKST